MPAPLPPTPALAPARSVPLVGLSRNPVPARVHESGLGRPVCFLHGLVGLNDHWDEVVRRIAHRYRATMLELPLLDLRDDDCSIDGATALTIRFLEQTTQGKGTVLVGNSFGGHVALRIALERPDLVSGLVLAGASGLIEKTMVSDIQIRPSRAWLDRKIGELFFDHAKMNQGDVDRAHLALSDRGGARAMVKLSRSARRNHLGDEIHRITAPTLIIWGRQDVVTPPEAAEQFLANIKGSRIVWLDQCGHAPMIEKPDEFAEAMLEFADELDRRASR